MTFAEIQKRAEATWRQFRGGPGALVLVGDASCGRAAGSSEVIDAIRSELGKIGKQARVVGVGCLGICYAEPLVEIALPGTASVLYGKVTPAAAKELARWHVGKGEPRADLALATTNGASLDGVPRLEDLPMMQGQARLLTRNCGRIAPDNIDHYIANGGYQGLAKALTMSPEDVITEVERSGLRGRGGVGFPTGRKWRFVYEAAGSSKHIVANAEEGEPGTFKDRFLLESDPHALLEGMLIAGYAVGAGEGHIFVQAHYPALARTLRTAINQAYELGLCGAHALGADFSFELELRTGISSYVCGEETGLLESLESKRPVPRARPPYPAQAGLWAEPTVVNNVETLANAPLILERGADAFRSLGAADSPGAKLFTLAGDVSRPGVVEFPLGVTLRRLIEGAGGGLPEGAGLGAVLLGGIAGGFLPPEYLDTPVDFDSLQPAGAMMGTGAILVADESRCVLDILLNQLEFLSDESCGKCVPCRLGTRQMLNIVKAITEGRGRATDVENLKRIGAAMKVASACGLGQAAPNPVLSAIRHFGSVYEAHIGRGVCPAGVCPMHGERKQA